MTSSSSSSSLNYWRSYFRTADSDIFGVIDHAIMIAAADCPEEFRLRRDRIAELLFSCRTRRCSGCEKPELFVPCEIGDDEVGHDHDDVMRLTDEIEQESRDFDEVIRIKELFNNSEHESDDVLYESLRKLELMCLSVETLKVTEIGKAVNRLRKRGSLRIRNLARELIEGWKVMVDEWVNATTAVGSSGGTEVVSDVVDPSVDYEFEDGEEFEDGLPTPPLDEGAFFATQTASMELSEFFDGVEDYGNPRKDGQNMRNRDNGRKSELEKQKFVKSEPVKVKQEVDVKPNRSLNTNSAPRRPPKINMEHNGVCSATKIEQRTEKSSIQKRQVNSQQRDKHKCSADDAVQVKLEATKRKLQESYQQAQNAKKQRTVKVMELHDLPKQGLGHRNPHLKPGNQNRQRVPGRRL